MTNYYPTVKIAASRSIGGEVCISVSISIRISCIGISAIRASRGAFLPIVGSCTSSLTQDARIKLFLCGTYPIPSFNPTSYLFVFRIEFYPVSAYISTNHHFTCAEIVSSTCSSVSGFRIYATSFLYNGCQAIIDKVKFVDPARSSIRSFYFDVFSSICTIEGFLPQALDYLSEFDSGFSAILSAGTYI